MNQLYKLRIENLISILVTPKSDRQSDHRSEPYNRVILLLVCMFFLLTSGSALAQTQFSDDVFDIDENWIKFGPYVTQENAPNGAFSARQIDGTNPFMEVSLTRATATSGDIGTWGAYINKTLMWDPAENALGPIGKIDVFFDEQGGGAWSLAVRQGEFVWMAVAKRFLPPTVDPFAVDIKNLDEEDFIPLPGSEFVVIGQPAHPDFSSDGAPVFFGIGTGLSCPSNVDCKGPFAPVLFEVDNFLVTVWSYVPLNAGHIGSWWNGPERAGEGLNVEIADGGNGSLLMVATIYSYNTLGDQIFMIMIGPVDGDQAELDVFITEGGLWGNAFDAELVMETQWGTGTLWSCGCDNLRLSLRPSSEYQAQGFTDLLNYGLIHLTQSLIPCPFIQPTE